MRLSHRSLILVLTFWTKSTRRGVGIWITTEISQLFVVLLISGTLSWEAHEMIERIAASFVIALFAFVGVKSLNAQSVDPARKPPVLRSGST